MVSNIYTIAEQVRLSMIDYVSGKRGRAVERLLVLAIESATKAARARWCRKHPQLYGLYAERINSNDTVQQMQLYILERLPKIDPFTRTGTQCLNFLFQGALWGLANAVRSYSRKVGTNKESLENNITKGAQYVAARYIGEADERRNDRRDALERCGNPNAYAAFRAAVAARRAHEAAERRRKDRDYAQQLSFL